MVNAIPIFTEAAFGLTEAHQIEDRLRLVLRAWVEAATVHALDPFAASVNLPQDLRDALYNISRSDTRHGFPTYNALFAFLRGVGHRHHATGEYAHYLLALDRELWLLIKLVIEFNRLVSGESTIELTVAQRALLLGAVGSLARQV